MTREVSGPNPRHGGRKSTAITRAVDAATKACVTSFTETLSSELIGTGIKVCACAHRFHHVDGKPILRPNVPIMESEDLVEAALAAFALGDVIWSPALVDRRLLGQERLAHHAVFVGGRKAELSRVIARTRKYFRAGGGPITTVTPWLLFSAGSCLF